jgi:hypothetical protein
MSNKRNAASRRRELKSQGRDRLSTARTEWSDDVMGLALARGRGGRPQLRWTVDPDPFLALMALQRFRSSMVDVFELELVTAARDRGVPWSDIGFALNVSGEAVRKRLGAQVEQRLADLAEPQ